MDAVLATVRREHAATIQGMSATDADEFVTIVAAQRGSADLREAAKAGDTQAGRIERAIVEDQIAAVLEEEELRHGRPFRDVAEMVAAIRARYREAGKAN